MESLYRFLKYAAFALFLLMIVAVSANLFATREMVIPPHIEPQKTNITLPPPQYTFPFEKAAINVTSPVDPAVYIGAKNTDKETFVRETCLTRYCFREHTSR